jgi:hypothetical protein
MELRLQRTRFVILQVGGIQSTSIFSTPSQGRLFPMCGWRASGAGHLPLSAGVPNAIKPFSHIFKLTNFLGVEPKKKKKTNNTTHKPNTLKQGAFPNCPLLYFTRRHSK